MSPGTARTSIGLALVALLATVTPAVAEESPELPPLVSVRQSIPEGYYRGTLSWPQGSYRYSNDATDLAGDWSLSNGVVELQVVGTTVTGEWSFEMVAGGTGTSSGGRSGEASGTIGARGIVEGDANSACMSGAMDVTGTLVVEDAEGLMYIPVAETLPLSCDHLGWEIASSSCTALSGEWTVPLADAIRLSGAGFPTNGTFSLVRLGDAISTVTEETDVDALLVEMERVINSEPFDGPALGRVLRRVAEFEGNHALNLGCGQRDPQNNRIVGSFLFRLLIARSLQSQPPDLSTLRWLAYAALNTGLIGSASPQPERAAWLTDWFTQELTRLLNEAADARDASQLARISSFAGQYGWDQVEALADATYEQVRGQR